MQVEKLILKRIGGKRLRFCGEGFTSMNWEKLIGLCRMILVGCIPQLATGSIFLFDLYQKVLYARKSIQDLKTKWNIHRNERPHFKWVNLMLRP